MDKVSILKSFNNVFSNWFKTEALPHIANYYTNERKIPTNVDDLIKIFDLPHSPINPSNQSSFNTVMGLPNNASVISNTPSDTTKSGAKQGRKKNPEDPSATKCRYILTKGRTGQSCDAVSAAYGFCIACVSKGDALTVLEKEGISTDTIKKIKELKNSKPSLRAFLNDSSNLSSDHVSTTQSSSLNNSFSQELKFHEIPSYPGFYIVKELVPNAFFNRKTPNDPYVCMGKMKMEDGNGTGPFALTNEEARLITSKGYAYVPPMDSKQQHPAAVPASSPNPTISNFVPPNPLMSNITSSQQSNFAPNPAISNFATSQQSSLTPPTVMMPPFMSGSNTVSQMVGQSIMNSVPDIIKNAMDNNASLPAFSF